jgi:3-phytase
MKKNTILTLIALGLVAFACNQKPQIIEETTENETVSRIQPAIITEPSFDDTDDPCIWINYENPDESLIIGTDKHETNGGIYVYNLDGKINQEKTILGLKRPNNIDLVYNFNFNGEWIDIAVFTERKNKKIRVLRVPQMEFIDNGGIDVFEDSEQNSPMGISLYQNPVNKEVFAIVGRKKGPSEGYLYQYLLHTDNSGFVKGKLVRQFGAFSGKKEIESIAVDNELGYVYYSDEQFGIRKYYANPAMGDEELAVFGQGDFLGDSEGISIYPTEAGKCYIVVSNQQNGSFNIYTREGSALNPHEHQFIKEVPVMAKDSDGSDVTPFTFNGRFRGGLFVAMSTDKTFHFYHFEDFINHNSK